MFFLLLLSRKVCDEKNKTNRERQKQRNQFSLLVEIDNMKTNVEIIYFQFKVQCSLLSNGDEKFRKRVSLKLWQPRKHKLNNASAMSLPKPKPTLQY